MLSPPGLEDSDSVCWAAGHGQTALGGVPSWAAGPLKAEEGRARKSRLGRRSSSRHKQAEATADLDEATKKRISGLFQAAESLMARPDEQNSGDFEQETDHVQQRQREVQQRIDALRGQAPRCPQR